MADRLRLGVVGVGRIGVFHAQHIQELAAEREDCELVAVADQHELRTRDRSEGVIFSVRSFGIKTTQGVGGLLAGFGLEFIGFPENAEVGRLAQETLTGLLFLNGQLFLIIYLIAALFMTMYQLDKNSHTQILEQLESRRAKS